LFFPTRHRALELELASAESKFANACGILNSINPEWLEP
jgi:hypothetical protein